MSGAVSIDAQVTPKLNSSPTQFEKFGMRCQSNGKNPLPALVTEVASNSPAYRKRLQIGDGIVALKGSADAYSITIDRNGKLYAVSLSVSDLAPNAALNVRSAAWSTALKTFCS